MEATIAKEVEGIAAQFPEWDNTIRAYHTHLYSDEEQVSDRDVATVQEVHKILETILRVASRSGHFKEIWEFSDKLDLFPFGQDTTLSSRKTGTRFTIGIYHREIFLSSYFAAPGNIKNMGDDFWSYFVDLRSLGDFRFQENAVPSSPEARKIIKHFKNGRSCIFQVIRNYILLEEFDRDCVDLGSLEIKWPLTLSWSEIVSRAARAFRCLYKINYVLYRCDYQRDR